MDIHVVNAVRATCDYKRLQSGIPMKRIILAALFAALATAAQAQSFYTLKSGPEAWWLRAAFNPAGTEVRGIPVKSIKPNWCRADEFTPDNMKDLLAMEQAGQTMKEAGLSFAVEGNFDRTKVKQVALVGVYQECGGKKGSFLLVVDAGTTKVRYVDAMPGEEQFAAVGAHKNDIVFTSCLECDGGVTMRWNAKRKIFAAVPQRGH
jgi:hypothetical protein